MILAPFRHLPALCASRGCKDGLYGTHPPTKDSCAKRMESLQATSRNVAYRADFDGYHLIIYYTIPANVLRSLSPFFLEIKCDSALAWLSLS